MGKTYNRAPQIVEDKAQALILRNYPDIDKAELKIDYLFCFSDAGPAITNGGYPAIGQCKVISLKDRSKGMGDVEIMLDQTAFMNMSSDQQDALIDHELNHIIILRDDDGLLKTDDLNRPRVTMRKHDYQMGWFTCIAQRHGAASPEVYQAKILFEENGQAFFPALISGNAQTPSSMTIQPLEEVQPDFSSKPKKKK